MSLTEQIGWIILSIALSAAVVGAIWIMVHRYRQKLRRAAEQWSSRPRMSDEEFLKICQIPDDPLKMRVALTARTVIAEFAMVPARRLSDDSSRTSGACWDSVDWLDILLRIEKGQT